MKTASKLDQVTLAVHGLVPPSEEIDCPIREISMVLGKLENV